MAVSKFDKKYLSEEQQNRIGYLTDAAQRGAMDIDTAHKEVEDIRATAGYSGGDDGSKYIPLRNEKGDFIDSASSSSKQASSSAPKFASSYDSTLRALANEIVGNNYDSWTKGSSYAELAKRYTANGRQAMQDTLAQIAARTGGMASSYAGTASQQTYNDYMTRLEEAARSMYDAEQNEKQNKISILRGLSDDEYSRYLNRLNQYNTDRSFNYNAQRDAIADARYDAETDYAHGRDAKADEQYDSETEYERGQAAQIAAQNRIKDYISSGRDPKNLDPSLIEASGYTEEELIGLREAAINLILSKKSSSGTSKKAPDDSTSESEEDMISLFMAADEQENPTEYITKHYKDFGFSSANSLISQYRNEWVKSEGALDMPQKDADSFLRENNIDPSTAVSREDFYGNGKVVNGKRYDSYYDYIDSIVEERNTNASKYMIRNQIIGRSPKTYAGIQEEKK